MTLFCLYLFWKLWWQRNGFGSSKRLFSYFLFNADIFWNYSIWRLKQMCTRHVKSVVEGNQSWRIIPNCVVYLRQKPKHSPATCFALSLSWWWGCIREGKRIPTVHISSSWIQTWEIISKQVQSLGITAFLKWTA